MTIEQALKAAGAKCVAGDLILDNQSVGQYRNEVFQPSLAGLAAYEGMHKERQEEILLVARQSLADTAPEQERPRRGRQTKPKVEDYEVGSLSLDD